MPRKAITSTLIAALATLSLGAAGPAAGAAKSTAPPRASDPNFFSQWQLADDAVMGVRSAWRATTGASGVTVAVVDTGADLGHRDLVPNLWTNAGEIPGNGIDDDGNGFADDVHGWDVVDHDGTPADENGHGTHVAGIIGARGDNRVGVAGVAWTVRLMIVRAIGANGRGDLDDVAAGIRYAVANGARVVNLSVAGAQDDAALEAALEEARAAGVLVVAAAGNAGSDLDAAPSYPAASPAPNVIAVASTDERGGLAAGSSFGRRSVDVAAPGENILSTAAGGGYELRSGTSQAAAAVTGALALMAAARPAATADQLRAALLSGARRTGLPVASGSLDAAAALRRLGVAKARAARSGRR